MSPSSGIGERPELRWLPVASLAVDHRYQRTLESKRSKALIDSIAARFNWSAFQAVLAAPGAEGTWLLLDGQHRVEAARRCGIDEVPAVVVAAGSLEEQAAAFVRANTDRVAVNGFALHHARLAAGDDSAAAVAAACAASGIIIPRYQIQAARLKPGETIAIASIGLIIKRHGAALATCALQDVAAAFAGAAGRLSAALIRAAAEIVAQDGARLPAGRLTEVLRGMTARQLEDRVRAWRDAHAGTEAAALIAVLRARLGGLAIAPPAKPKAVPIKLAPLPKQRAVRPDPYAALRRLHADGKGAPAIAAALGESIVKVTHILDRLGLKHSAESRRGETARSKPRSPAASSAACRPPASSRC